MTKIFDRRDIKATPPSIPTVKPVAYMDLFHAQNLKYIRKICSPVIFLAIVVVLLLHSTYVLHTSAATPITESSI